MHTMTAPTTAVETLRRIVAERTAEEIRGVIVDHGTASLLLELLDKLSPPNAAKLRMMIETDVARAGAVAWKVVSK